MLKGNQKRVLRSMAQTTKPLIQIGKSGISDSLIANLNIQLNAHELVKLSILQNCFEDKEAIAKQLAEETSSELVQIIGHQIVLYRESKKKDKNDRIKLPR